MLDVLTERLVDFLLYVLISIVKIMNVENDGDWNVELSEVSDAGRGADQTQIAWYPRGGGSRWSWAPIQSTGSVTAHAYRSACAPRCSLPTRSFVQHRVRYARIKI